MSRGSTASDVVIIGGGLAGLTLGLQLADARPGISITILERRRHPLPDAIAKVGESTVEIGAHYLAEVLRQRDYLATAQLPKFGLRCFFGAGGDDLSTADELGVSQVLSIPTYQIDRGPLENHLAAQAVGAGLRFVDGARMTGFSLDPQQHSVTYTSDAGSETLRCRWLVDAAGRSSPLKTRLGLAETSQHKGNAVWFRVEGRIEVDQWSSRRDWHNRVNGSQRWLSTNHLMGPGYWVWLIPLACGATSVGIVTDPSLHDIETMNSFESSLKWLSRNQPRCARALAGRKVLDFRVLRNYAYGCKQVFSADRWCLTGEAGVFLDPFYSPGTDFIGIANTFITDLVSRQLDGENIQVRSAVYDKLYFSLYESTLNLFSGLYPGFGDRRLMPVKMTWDYAFYWGILGQLFFNGALTDLKLMAALSGDLRRIQATNGTLQSMFRRRAGEARQLPPRGMFVDQRQIHLLRRFNEELVGRIDADALKQRIAGNVDTLIALAGQLKSLLDDPDGPPDGDELALLGDLRQRLVA